MNDFKKQLDQFKSHEQIPAHVIQEIKDRLIQQHTTTRVVSLETVRDILRRLRQYPELCPNHESKEMRLDAVKL